MNPAPIDDNTAHGKIGKTYRWLINICCTKQTIESILQSSYLTCFHKVMKMVNVASTCYSTTRRAVTSVLEGDSALSVMADWFTGMIFGALIGVTMSFACVVPKAIITVISVLATLLIVPQVIEDWKNGDYDLAVAGGLQMLSSLSAIFMKCFTGDTLVATEDGDKRIDEIAVGDFVWAEDTVTGEQVLKRVSKVYVKETDHLIHIGTSTGEDIETTENHPFYTEERGWVAASELEEGETLHTEDGSVVTVTYNQDEWLREPVKVYNLEVERLHTYYVTVDRVLVHNEYGQNSDIDDAISQVPDDLKQEGKCDGFAQSLVGILKKLGIPYEIIRIDSDFYVYSDKANMSIGNKYHYGVKIGDFVYDNMTPNGMNFEAWLSDLGLTGEFDGIDWSFVNEILNH